MLQAFIGSGAALTVYHIGAQFGLAWGVMAFLSELIGILLLTSVASAVRRHRPGR